MGRRWPKTSHEVTTNDNLGDHLRRSLGQEGTITNTAKKGLDDLRNTPLDHKMELKTITRGNKRVDKVKPGGKIVERFRKQHGRYPKAHPSDARNEWLAIAEIPEMRDRQGKPLQLGHAIRLSRVHPSGSGHKKQHKIGIRGPGFMMESSGPKAKYRGLGFVNWAVGWVKRNLWDK